MKSKIGFGEKDNEVNVLQKLQHKICIVHLRVFISCWDFCEDKNWGLERKTMK